MTTLRTIFDVSEQSYGTSDGSSEEDGQEEEGTGAPGQGSRRFKDLAVLFSQPQVVDAVRSALPALHEDPGPHWEHWLRRVTHETMGAALLAATQALVNEMSFDDLLVDVVPRGTDGGGNAPSAEFDVYISEETPGGAGLVERVEALIQDDPQRFLALLEGALEASDPEQARVDLGLVAGWLAESCSSHRPEVAQAAGALRGAQSHQDETHALEGLTSVLSDAGLFLHPVTLAAVNLRLLRPGSSANTDDLYHRLYSQWDRADETLGFEVNPRVFAEMMSHDDSIDDLLASVTEGQPPADRAHWRFSVLNGLLWPSRGTLRLEALRYYNPFAEAPTCDRLLITTLIVEDVPVIDVSVGTWRDELASAVRGFGAVDLVAPAHEGRSIRAALLDLAVKPLDVGAVAVYPRVRGFSQREGVEAVRVEVPELFGAGRDG